MLQINRLFCDKVRGCEAGEHQLLPGLSAQPHIFLKPWYGQKASSSHWLNAVTLLQPFASC